MAANKLYFGDNLVVLRHEIPSESVPAKAGAHADAKHGCECSLRAASAGRKRVVLLRTSVAGEMGPRLRGGDKNPCFPDRPALSLARHSKSRVPQHASAAQAVSAERCARLTTNPPRVS